jgi:uncharacterized protein YodC (DUF2158 family)
MTGNNNDKRTSFKPGDVVVFQTDYLRGDTKMIVTAVGGGVMCQWEQDGMTCRQYFEPDSLKHAPDDEAA